MVTKFSHHAIGLRVATFFLHTPLSKIPNGYIMIYRFRSSWVLELLLGLCSGDPFHLFPFCLFINLGNKSNGSSVCVFLRLLSLLRLLFIIHMGTLHNHHPQVHNYNILFSRKSQKKGGNIARLFAFVKYIQLSSLLFVSIPNIMNKDFAYFRRFFAF